MKTREPQVSVIMPAFNADITLEEAINSVLSQSFDDFELIVINDCSTDRTGEIIDRYATRDDRLLPIHLRSNQGVAKARNTGIDKAKGRYISFLDADDLWLPEKLERQLAELRAGASLVYSSYLRFKRNDMEKIVNVPESITYAQLLKGNRIGNLTGIYDSHQLGKFFQDEIGHEDYLMWLQICRKAGRGIGIQQPLARYRVSPASLSANKLKAIGWTWQIYRDKLSLGLIPSCYLLGCSILGSIRKRI